MRWSAEPHSIAHSATDNVEHDIAHGIIHSLARSSAHNILCITMHISTHDILNSVALTPATQDMYKVLGAYIGYSFLTKSPIPLCLAPIVWKQILQEKLTLNDLDDIDSYSVQVLKEL